MRALLIAGGMVDVQWADEFIKMYSYDRIIAVDGGLSAANLLSLKPDMIVGDFDSVRAGLLSQYTDNAGCEIVRLNPEKDDTDTQCAVIKAIEAGADEIHILGGTGGRMDHMLSNIFMLKLAYERGVRAVMYDRVNKISVIQGKTLIKKDNLYGRYISFIQLEGPVKAVTLDGLKYRLDNFDIDTSKEYRMAVSNEFIGDTATIDMAEGMLVMIEIGGE